MGNEEEPTDNNGQGGNTEVKRGHPAWDEVINELPESLRPLVIPTLEKWDKGVQEKIQSLHSEYEPYKKLKENEVPIDVVEQALYLMKEFNENPKDVVAQAIEEFGLDYVEKALEESMNNQQQQQQQIDPSELPYDIASDPRFQALEETLKKLESNQSKIVETEEQRRKDEEFNKTLEGLHEQHGEFDDIGVTALMASGINGEQAVKQWNDIVNQAAAKIATQGNSNQQEETPPVVMGAAGASGSGLPDGAVNFGSMSKGDVGKLVQDMLSQKG